MKLTEESKETIDKISLISGLKKGDIRSLFESLLMYSIMNYLENEKTYIPFLGSIEFEFIKDICKNGKKEAQVNLNYQPDKYLLRNIGQIEDGEESEIEQLLKMRIQSTLSEFLD